MYVPNIVIGAYLPNSQIYQIMSFLGRPNLNKFRGEMCNDDSIQLEVQMDIF